MLFVYVDVVDAVSIFLLTDQISSMSGYKHGETIFTGSVKQFFHIFDIKLSQNSVYVCCDSNY